MTRGKKLKILLVDDDTAIRKGLGLRLENSGYEVVGAADGKEALKLVAKEDPDIIILDVMMPKVDGYEVAKELRKLPKWRPIIMVSALGKQQEIVKGYKHEADYYLTKPYKIDQLLEGLKVMESLIPIRRR